MKTLISVTFLLYLNIYCYSQKNYTEIPRTKVSMIIPKGYHILDHITGLQKDNDQVIIIADNIEGNYYFNARDFNKKSYESKGKKILEYLETTVDGFPAKEIITYSEDTNYKSLSLVFGDSTFSTFVTSIYLADDKRIEKKQKKILHSIKYNKEKIVDPFENVRFTADTSLTDFKFTLYSTNLYIYSPFGQEKPDDKSMVMLTPTGQDSTMNLEEIAKMIISEMRKHGMYGFLTDSTSKYTTNDTDAFLTIGNCYNRINKMFFLNLILARENYSLIISGFCYFKDEHRKSEIYEFCKSIRIFDK